MGLWSGLKDAKTWDKGKYMKPDFNGTVKIVKTIAKKSRKSGLGFICELEVVTTNMEKEHPVGSKATWWQGMDDTDVAFPAVTAWAAACMGIDPTDADKVKAEVSPDIEDMMDMACEHEEDEDKNPFLGIIVGLQTWHILTAKKKQDFTVYNWTVEAATA